MKIPLLLSLLSSFLPVVNASVKLYGVNYGLRIGPDWTSGADRCKSINRTVAELQQLQNITNNVRVFSMTDCDTASILLETTQQLGMGVWLGLWVGPDQLGFDGERLRLQELLGTRNFTNVLGIHVSSEAIYRGDITFIQALEMRNTIKGDMDWANYTDIPVTIADVGDTYVQYPRLIRADPLAVTLNQFPFWERVITINGDSTVAGSPDWPSAAEYMLLRLGPVVGQLAGRQLIITETGWADDGINPDSNPANPASMAKWMRDFVCLADERGWQYFWFNAYDSDWRRINEMNPDDVEGHFGMFDEMGVLKPHIRDLVIDCSQPYTRVDENGVWYPATSPPSIAPPTAPVAMTLSPTATPFAVPMPTSMPVTLAPTMAVNPPVVTTVPSSTPVAETVQPTINDTPPPTGTPTAPIPTSDPTLGLTSSPQVPASEPTGGPMAGVLTVLPTVTPTPAPSAAPSNLPTAGPTTDAPSNAPSAAPSIGPSNSPSAVPSTGPSDTPSVVPTSLPTAGPSLAPSDTPSQSPSVVPTLMPSSGPTEESSILASTKPSFSGSDIPSGVPTTSPSGSPTDVPETNVPTTSPTDLPTSRPATSTTPPIADFDNLISAAVISRFMSWTTLLVVAVATVIQL